MIKDDLLLTPLNTEKACIEYAEQVRWSGNVRCPHCGHGKVYRTSAKTQPFKCASSKCYKKFSVTVGTVFQGTQMGIMKYFEGVYVISSVGSVGSSELAMQLGVTQKSAWWMINRLSVAFKKEKGKLFIQETFDEAIRKIFTNHALPTS